MAEDANYTYDSRIEALRDHEYPRLKGEFSLLLSKPGPVSTSNFQVRGDISRPCWDDSLRQVPRGQVCR